MSHNQRLHQFLRHANEVLDNATEPKELIEIVDESRKFNGNFRFNNRNYYLLFGALFTAFCGVGFFAYQTGEGLAIFGTLAILMGSFALFNQMRARNRRTDNLAERIFFRDLLFDNDLALAESIGRYNINNLQHRFTEFQRGNYSRSIELLIRGNFTGKKKTFSFHYLHFHYVNEREVTETDSEGRTRTRKVYDHFDRYGILAPFPYLKDLKIRQERKLIGLHKGTYQPASIDFNKNFHVWAKDEFSAAKFLKPATVHAIEKIPENFTKSALEFSDYGELLFIFDNDDLIQAQRRYDLTDPDAFLEEIAGITELPKLRQALEVIEELLAQSDNNFA